MKLGILAIPDITMWNITTPQLHDGYSYQKALYDGIVYNADRNAGIVDLIKQHKGKKILLTFRFLRHGDLLSRLLYDENIAHEVVKGEVSGEEREKIRHRFERGDLDVIVASIGVFKLGVDLPSIEVLIRADGGKSKISTIQILGRALRVKDNRKRVLVYDFYDDTHTYLRRHSRKRLRDYRSLGDPVVVKQRDLNTGQQFLAF